MKKDFEPWTFRITLDDGIARELKNLCDANGLGQGKRAQFAVLIGKAITLAKENWDDEDFTNLRLELLNLGNRLRSGDQKTSIAKPGVFAQNSREKPITESE